jgi:Cof subfamily protein (haloacid dehalogenase superfamily)
VTGQNGTVRLLATDLDGTLLRSDGTVSAHTRSVLDRAAAVGFPVVMATGRPIRWLPEVRDSTGLTGLAVAANGALLYDLDAEEVVAEHALQPEPMRTITSALREAFPRVRFAVEYGVDFGYEERYRHEWEVEPAEDKRGRLLPKVTMGELEDIISRPAVKLLARNPDEFPDSFLADATTVLGTLASVTRSGTSSLVEISAPGVTKASGLAAVAARRRVDATDVAAVGDMPNDVPMLQWAGHSFAVANAHSDVVAAADHILASNDEDAVAGLLTCLLDARRAGPTDPIGAVEKY